MAIFRCKMCGGDLEIRPGESVATCEYCGTTQTLPKLDDDRRINLYDRANHFRRNNEFDKAMGIYEQILNEDNSDAEAYWSIVLCRYGIEYVEDPASHKRVPTVNRAQYTSIFADEDYKAALDHADSFQRKIYESEAKAIDEIQKGILEISSKEDPFDVFICYKETDANGRRTVDSVLATDLYHQLTQEGFKVFFSRITLEDKIGTAYEPYIFAALNSAKVMVVLGTKPEYFNAVWVKNEWSRYLSLVKQSGGKKVLIPAYRDMDPYDLPEEFSHLQAQDMSKLGFMQDLIRGIKKIVRTDEPNVTVKETAVIGNAGNVAPLLKRVFLFLEDGEWSRADDFCEQVLNQDPENAQAYLGKLMAELHVRRQEDLEGCGQPFNNSNNYRKVVRFGDDKLAEILSGYIDHIKERNENARLTGIYNNAVTAMNSANTESEYKAAEEEFKKIPGFQDADALAKQCHKKAEETVKIAKQNAEAVIRALKESIKTEEGPKKEEELSSLKARAEYLGGIQAIFSETRAQIEKHKESLAGLFSQETRLQDRRSKLGLFSGKEKKRIDEELAELSQKKNVLKDKITQFESRLGGYSDIAVIQREINKAMKSVSELEEQIADMKKASAQDSAIHKYSFEEAVDLYMNDSSVAATVNAIWPEAMFYLASIGEINSVQFGRYVQITNHQPEPIEWNLLAQENGSVLIISKYVLDCKPYNTLKKDITWETCSLRKWLNGAFLSAAFSERERAMISLATVKADKNPNYSTSPGKSTKDQVFLLSIKEVKKYFSPEMEMALIGEPTLYCWEKLHSYDYADPAWWLRSPGSDSTLAAFIGPDGALIDDGECVDDRTIGVRPALWINLR